MPPARVNIKLDIATGHETKRKELPLKLLLLGHYSNKSDQAPIAKRRKISVNANNLNQVMSSLSPELQLTIPNVGKENELPLLLKLKFKQLADFHPDHVAHQIPELRNLLAMRNILKDLKANLINKHEFRKTLKDVLSNKQKLKQLADELKETAPLNSVLEMK